MHLNSGLPDWPFSFYSDRIPIMVTFSVQFLISLNTLVTSAHQVDVKVFEVMASQLTSHINLRTQQNPILIHIILSIVRLLTLNFIYSHAFCPPNVVVNL